ncbi:hypothetical protein EN845_29115 [Mesorhizobium sp. M8A.F.Ca.ET.202.01.1.1]|nr:MULTISPECIES: hypothetical protein [unclassified Mesorhizobium]TGR17824.1 hypothetical protein EN845_29115 [Mesorhizobium sp. M8A.F.Ca.ET.202.01.1.1]TGR37740.1 hypothetical protein EN842_48985 [bacterium M00.F.Ca.ET.199.01.1.1]
MRKRVERLLAEGFRHDDITKLLLWLRERSYGVSSIREIGDFVAHSDTKTKGAVTQELRDFFRYLELRMNSTNLNEQGKKPAFLQIKLENLPPDFPSIVMERFRKLDSSEINRTTGLNRKAAELALKAVLQKFSTGPNGELSLTSARTKDEAAILTTSLNSMMPTPTLTQAALWRDFCFVLKKNNLLEDREQKLLKPVERGLVLFSIATMHGTEMTLVSGRVAKLSAGIRKNGNLCVAAAGEWDMIGAFGSAVVPVFDTDLLASECCDPALSVDAGNKYNEPLDVSADLRLVAL